MHIVYAFTEKFPTYEPLRRQMQRAVHSVHLNIAEGSGRLSNGEWQQFLGQARGSCLELESAAISAFDLHYCTAEEGAELTASIRAATKQINGLLASSKKGFRSKKFQPEKPKPKKEPPAPADG